MRASGRSLHKKVRGRSLSTYYRKRVYQRRIAAQQKNRALITLGVVFGLMLLIAALVLIID